MASRKGVPLEEETRAGVKSERARTSSLTKKAVELWALDRKQCKLATAMGQLKDGKIPSNPAFLLEALVKHESELHLQEEKANERERRRRESDLRRRKTLDERRNAVADKQDMILEHKAARANERIETLEMRRRLKENDAHHLLDMKRMQQQYRRERERFELVEQDWNKQDLRNKNLQEREATRRVRTTILRWIPPHPLCRSRRISDRWLISSWRRTFRVLAGAPTCGGCRTSRSSRSGETRRSCGLTLGAQL
mmetsp:Transcript_32241/g.72430  ORF Transcript_32241/g.72430 Transcript_32241/m.72430 type:complete len:253 (-) Transcript_32241:2349-3107(-)